jgi:hypothetical protein
MRSQKYSRELCLEPLVLSVDLRMKLFTFLNVFRDVAAAD